MAEYKFGQSYYMSLSLNIDRIINFLHIILLILIYLMAKNNFTDQVIREHFSSLSQQLSAKLFQILNRSHNVEIAATLF